MYIFNGVTLTEETVKRTRQHFIDIYQGCIDEVLSGDVVLPEHTKQEDYFAYQRERMEYMKAGKGEHNFTFLQRAYWLQTGESIALLPK